MCGACCTTCTGPGKANEHTDPHLVAGFGDPAELEPRPRPTERRDFRRLTGLLTQPLAALNGDNYAQPVWHCAVRAAPEDRVLSDAEWARVAAHVMHRTGLAPDGDDLGVRWVAVRHAAGSHPPGGHAGPAGPAPAGAVEQLPQAAPGVPGQRGVVRAAAHRSRRIAPPRSGPPGLSRSRRSGAGGMSRRGPGCAGRCAPRRPGRAPRTEFFAQAGAGRGAGAPPLQHASPR